jgi:hypothetical protein
MVGALRSTLRWAAAAAALSVSAAQGSEQLVARLEQQGFFRFATNENAAATKTAIVKNGWKGLYAIEGRLIAADSEDLAEDGVCEFLRTATFLATQNAAISACTDDFGKSGDQVDSYHVVVAGERHLVWDASDLARARRDSGWLWGISAKRVTDLLTARLKRAGSSERAYGLYGGNEFHVFFLTPTLMTTIAEIAKSSPQEIPYVVTNEYPWFGATPVGDRP